MVCTDRQLTDAQREAGFQQNTGVQRAVRPFSGAPTLDNLVDYMNRELVPAVQSSRAKVNEVYRQVADNAPSANPLAYYFSTTTTNADPTTGRIRLDQATQNTATTLRVSQSNARLQDVTPWLDIMSGGATAPLGVVTLLDAVNPGRFIRGDLSTMIDQGAYWDLGISVVESSDTNPFVDGEAVIVSFIAGVSGAGSTVPVGSLSPVARDTFIGNIGTTTAPPSAVPLANIGSASIVYDGTSHTFQLATISPGRVKGLQIDAAGAAIPVDLIGAEVGELLRRAFLVDGTGVTIGANHNFALDQRASVLRVNPGSVGGNVTFTGFALGAGGTTGNAGGFFLLVKQGASDSVTLAYEDTGSSANNRNELPGAADITLTQENLCVMMHYWGGRWQMLGAPFLLAGTGINISATGVVTVDQSFNPVWTGNHTFTGFSTLNGGAALNERVFLGGVISASFGSSTNDWNPTGFATASVIRATATAVSLDLSGLLARPGGGVVLLINVGTNAFKIDNEGAASTAANRFLHNVDDFELGTNEAVWLWYDDTSARWRCIHVAVTF